MNKLDRISMVAVVALAAMFAPLTASALREFAFGNAPVRDAGWPAGAVEVANLKTRLGYSSGDGGGWEFFYRGNLEEVSQVLTNFAAIRAPVLELVIHDWKLSETILAGREKNNDTNVDCKFSVWTASGSGWNGIVNNPSDPLFTGRSLPAPRLEVYLGSRKLDWSRVKVPANIKVRDERTSAAGAGVVEGSLVRVEALDMATHKPVKDVRLIVSTMVDPQKPQGGYRKIAEATGDASGRADLAKLPPGTHRVILEAADYAPKVVGQDIYGEHTFKEFKGDLSRVATISGTVTDTDSKPLKGVKVSATGITGIDRKAYGMPEAPEATTDENGIFTFSGLPAGQAGFRPSVRNYYFRGQSPIHDVPGTNVLLKMSGAGNLLVLVTDRDGRPISKFEGNVLLVNVDARIAPGQTTIGTWGGNAKVREDGTYEFTNFPPGEYRVSSYPNPRSSNRQYAAEQIVVIKVGETTTIRMGYE